MDADDDEQFHDPDDTTTDTRAIRDKFRPKTVPADASIEPTPGGPLANAAKALGTIARGAEVATRPLRSVGKELGHLITLQEFRDQGDDPDDPSASPMQPSAFFIPTGIRWRC